MRSTSSAPDPSPEPGGTDAGGVRSVHRVIDLLTRYDVLHPTRTVRELTEATGLPKTTVVRLVATLVQRGLLSPEPDGTFALGAAFLQWVDLIPRLTPVSGAVRDVMRDLATETGETVNLYIRQGTSRICIAQQEGTASVRHVIAVGAPMHLWAGAASKVLLNATLDPKAGAAGVIDAVAAQSPHGPDFAESLRAQAAAVTETGYAVSHGERELGASGVAAPVRDGTGRIVSALAIGGPTSRFSADRLAGYVAAVLSAAEHVTKLGGN